MTETIVAVYDTAAHADAAIRDLEAANIPSSAITSHASMAGDIGSGALAKPVREPGFWSSLLGGEPEYDTAVYDRSVDGGATVVTVKVADEHTENVTRILESHNPVDIDDRAASYGLASATTTATRPMAGLNHARDTAMAKSGQEVVQLAEEQLSIGKRLVNLGTTRIRRFVIETPVEESVTLHSERVSIERRPAAAGATVTDADFKDRVIEMTETEEEAVVGKTVRVKEEVVIRKDVADRVETVRDTVRHEDVEITRDGTVQTATTGPLTGPSSTTTTGTTKPTLPRV